MSLLSINKESMKNIHQLFEDAQMHFGHCLTAFQNHELHESLKNLRSSLLAIEEFDQGELTVYTQKNVTLFVQIFQFEVLARDEVWGKTPKLYTSIGESIHSQYEYENEFRHNVIKQDLGRLLDFTI